MRAEHYIEACRRCGRGIDMAIVGSGRVLAHGDVFCSMACADAWEQAGCDCGCSGGREARARMLARGGA